MARFGSPLGSKPRARRGHQGKRDAECDAEEEALRSDDVNRRVMQVLWVLQGFCCLGFGHYFNYHRNVDRPFAFDNNVEFSLAPELQPSGVYDVNDLSLPLFLSADTNGSLVYFYSERCSHCKKLLPAYEAAARELMISRNFPLGMVDLDRAPVAAKKYGVHRVPTVLLFKNKRVVSEMPPSARSAAKILEFVRSSLEPAVVGFPRRGDFEDGLPQMRSLLQPKSPPLIVGFQSPDTYSMLDYAAEQSRGKTIFLWVGEKSESDPELTALFGSADKDLVYKGIKTPEAVSAWVKGLLSKKR